jgi:hypothetical protein
VGEEADVVGFAGPVVFAGSGSSRIETDGGSGFSGPFGVGG